MGGRREGQVGGEERHRGWEGGTDIIQLSFIVYTYQLSHSMQPQYVTCVCNLAPNCT